MSTRSHIPSYRLHKQSGQAVVTLADGLGQRRDVLLGKHGTPESRAEYARIIAEWEANGRRLLAAASTPAAITINELILAYWEHAKVYYGYDGGRSGACLRDALRIVKELYGHTAAKDFGPLALKAVRKKMVEKDWSRTYTNAQMDRLRRLFRWAAEEELLPASVHQNLLAVAGLRYGKSGARETAKVKPVSAELVEATLPHMPVLVQAMVRLQEVIGCRPTEVCVIRPLDLDMSNAKCWVYKPGSDLGAHGQHKTAHHGHDRQILIGPRAQEILRPYLGTKLDAYCFSPAASEQARSEKRRQGRRTPLTPSQAKRQRYKNPKRPKRDHYDVTSYRNAIYRACDKAFPLPEELAPRLLEDGKRESRAVWRARLTAEEKAAVRRWRKEHCWHPNRLRHSRATELRSFGLDVVKTILGHSKLETTQVYSEKDLAAAMEVVSKIG